MSDQHSFAKNDYEILSRDVMYQGVFRMVHYHFRHRLYEGGWTDTITHEVLERLPASGLLPYDPVLDRIVLIEQFRIATQANPKGPWLIEIVAGIRKPGETPEEVAIRESMEEASCVIETLYPVHEYFVSPGGSTEYMHIFCGKIDASNIGGFHGLADENENIRAFSLPAEEAFQWLRNGEIKSAPTIIALQWLQLNRDWLRSLWQR